MSSATEAELFDEFYQWRLEDAPELATMVGQHKYDDKLESYTLKSFEARQAKAKSLLERATNLYATQKSNDIELFIEMLQQYLDGFETKSFVFALCRIEGIHVNLAQTISYMKFDTEKHFHLLAKRLRAVPEQVEGIVEIMRVGIKYKLTMHAVSMQDVVESLHGIVDAEAAKTDFYKPVLEYSGKLSDEVKQDVLDAVKIAQDGFRVLEEFVAKEYKPFCRPSIAIASVGGESYYQRCLNYHLGCQMTAQEVHDVGLREVQRINCEILEVIKELGQDLTANDFADKMRHNEMFLLSSQDEIKKYYETLLEERIQPQLPKFFRKLPVAKLKIVLMDKSMAAGCAAFYIQGSKDGSRSGTFYVNGNDPHRIPTYVFPALALHEANPGHHFQTSRFLESPSVANFRLLMEDRKYIEMPTHFPIHTAYVEGWGLYCESLGHEMGIYKDPYEKYGHYSQEMLRACRLVVDTGMHAFGWSRDRAIAFLKQHTSSSLTEIESEIDRYITWPGQACAYKIGEIHIKKIRAKAENILGNKFDIRDFHEVVMDNVGSLSFLEKAVDNYINKNRQPPK